ncbi:MAG: membrane protein insertase YidC [Crocinitomicaceae bacterium]|nr:membrane protein insertase YidC [Crocinitomicaceae bacterium]
MNFDRNTIIGLLLMLLLGLGFSWYSARNAKENLPAPQAVTSTIDSAVVSPVEEKVPLLPANDSVSSDSASLASRIAIESEKFGVFAPASRGEEKLVVLENEKIRAELSTKGGLFYRVILKDGYTRYRDKKPVELWDTAGARMNLAWVLSGKGEMYSDQFYFTPSSDYVDARSGVQQLVMKLNTTDPAQFVEFIYSLTPDSYSVDCKVNIVGLGNKMEIGNKQINFHWKADGLQNEKGLSAERGKSSVYFCPAEGERDYLNEAKSDEETTEEKTTWVAYKQNYFSAAVIARDGFLPQSKLSVSVPEDSAHTKIFESTLGLPLAAGENTSTALTFFFGPNDYKVLKSLDVNEFDRIIDYGWSIIGTVNRYLIRPLFWFLSSFIGSFGLIILIVTLIIKMILFPVTWKNFLSSAKMRVLKPEIDEINKKYEGKDAVEKQQAIMGLYRQTGVNPFAGCIPVLLQMPILYAMFRFFPAEIVLRGKSFLWADDLAAYDSIFQLPSGWNIPFYGSHVSGFTLLMCLSTFVYTRMSMQAQPTVQQPGMPNMKVMMHIFTFMMLFFFNNMPSGLSLYYFTANVISIGQMWVIKEYIIDEDAIRAKIEDNKKKPKKKSSFAQRLEEVQKQQQKKLQGSKSKLKK